MSCPSRRAVLQGAAVVCGAGALAACGGGGGSEDGAGAGAGATPTGPPAPLARLEDIPVGGALSATAPGRKKVLLVRPTADEVVGLSAICTHQGCTVVPDSGALGCPCHGSVFELTGEVRRGPAETALAAFAVTVVDGDVLPA